MFSMQQLCISHFALTASKLLSLYNYLFATVALLYANEGSQIAQVKCTKEFNFLLLVRQLEVKNKSCL